MDFTEDSIKPIYVKIADWIEDEIIKDEIKEEEQVPSTNQLAAIYKINPATAGKGLNILVQQQIIYKKRGIGMFVASGAKEVIIKKRRESFCKEYIEKLLFEAEKIGITKAELIEMLSNM